MVTLIILDGFGVTEDPESTIWVAARKNFGEYEKLYPLTTLQASGIAVGLSWGEAGNSEVGHLTLGAGKTVYHHLPRISLSIQDGSFFENNAFKRASRQVKENLPAGKAGKSALHLMGVFSSGSVHAYPDHLYALLEFAKQEKLDKVYLHLFTDGRDASPKEANKFFGLLEERLSKLYPFARVSSIIGRDFSMDRDQDWEQIEKTYNLFTKGEGKKFNGLIAYLEEQYRAGITDEFIEPAWSGENESRIKEGDAVIFFNFREDSARELTQAFVEDGFDKFPRKKISDLEFVTMTEYEKKFSNLAAFTSSNVASPLSKVLSDNNLKQFHIAETEKYAHVTYFFNGGNEAPFPGEDRLLVESLPGSHYEEHPEMRAEKIADEVESRLKNYDFILVNLANADMVGHSGDFDATRRALEILDFQAGRIVESVLKNDGIVIITGDHGNAEEKRYRITGEKKTKHSVHPVPFFLIGKKFRRKEPRTKEEVMSQYSKVGGVISDVAPTILELMDIPKPHDMTGVSLLGELTE
ncbi:phosphoglycerate mutase (2,3-diphosphoglycerate-independent) [Candidatus Giovannonibacteria bacterium RIFCSPHIGHO2_02_43_16]|uniref:2,3-bisphosphoglycerate-independent phosphoglycerate mutase n=1 Tax=Candidatus Giovannonibacteria bacterium RIFCSPHIGHO2_02_43_16 TaxID=1798331 RepID=A0A1F5WCN2_9BACT|nr:MAG: phosphoglycerate mutase (2,3-diphosphoglycerate-independent) [Candidatus Giovannonibacteria bacterium RIFCSPHIGHO2_02_43_16]